MSFYNFHSRQGRRTGRGERGGFTLVELLVVLAIIAILASVAMPGLQGTLSGINLKGSSNILFSELDLARQVASTRNLSVDVRLYQDPNKPVDSNGNRPYRLIAIVISSQSSGATTDEFVGPPVALQGDIIIDSNPTYSSLLNTASGYTPSPTAVTAESTSAPLALQNKPYVRFVFLPSGALNLALTDGANGTGNTIAWTLTLLNQHAKASTVAGAPAANYITLLLDVATGRARVYQP